MRCMVLSNGKGPWSDKIVAVQACKPIYTLNIEHEIIWTWYLESITFVLKNKNNFIFRIIFYVNLSHLYSESTCSKTQYTELYFREMLHSLQANNWVLA